MDFDFLIPVARDDLLNKTNVSQYVVDEVYTLREIPGAIQDAKLTFRSKGVQCILKNFDAFFSALCLQKDVDVKVKEEAWTLIVKIGIALSSHLVPLLDSEYDSGTRQESLNMVKMTCYLLCQYMEMLESEETKPSTNQALMKGKKGKKKNSSMSMDWPRERESGMKTLLNLVQLNIQRLWDPPVAEEEFVSLVTSCCYRMLENPEITHVVNKETKDAICHIIGVMVKKYNHGLGASLKIIQLLQHFEHLVEPLSTAVQICVDEYGYKGIISELMRGHLVEPLSTAVQICVDEYGYKGIISELMREIGRMDAADLGRDTSGTRAYSAFLVDMAEKVPGAVLPNISLVICHLDTEAYAIRNGVLGAMGEILIQVLSKDGLDDKMKDTRDQFLEKLEDHIHDIHAFVRGRVLQIWNNIVSKNCLPLGSQENLLKLVIGRLQDKSSQVRKYAIQLITALLKNNPFAAKLSVQELEQNYMKEAESLKEMMPEEEQAPSTAESIKAEMEKEWTEISSLLKPVIEQFEEDEENRSTPDSLITEEDTKESLTEKIYDSLLHKKLEDAVKLINAARESFPDIGGQPTESQDETEEVTPLDTMTCLKNLFTEKKLANHALSAAQEPMETESQKDPELANELAKKQILVQYLKDSLAFATQVQNAVPVISLLLGSKTVTDVMEAIQFFVIGFEFGLSSTMIGIRRMLPLIWSKEASIKEAVVEAYKRLYLSPQGANPRAQAQVVVKNLSALTMNATLCDITCMEGLMQELVKSGDIGSNVIQMLWERFTKKIAGTTDEESRAAVTLLSMAAKADMGIVKSNIDVLVMEGLGPRAETDLLLAKETCIALLNLGVKKHAKGAVANEPYKLAENHEMFTNLVKILSQSVTDLENRYWIPLMEQAVTVIYKLGEYPDVICGDLIKKISTENVTKGEIDKEGEVNKEVQEDQNAENPDETGEHGQTEATQDKSDTLQFVTGVLARLISLVGQVALRQLVHLDVSVFGEMKRRRAIQEQKEWIQTPASKKTKDPANAENIEEEMGLGGAAAEDAESEFIRKICETEIVTGMTLLSGFAPLIVAICTHQQKYPDIELQTAASLALSKFMLVSSEFCDQHLQLLFTILEKSSSKVIRGNTIIALGDLCFRFPNLIEPWTPHLYARLRDESPLVRKNTIQVLTHLILNDMIKVKGQISEMANCIVDDDDRISNLAKLFFNELAKKGNAVYNIMPDMISRLSDPDVGVDEENFRSIMKYLFSFIQKDKHCESLVEKLCHRYRATRVDRQWRDLSFCLSMLSYSEKSVAKLHENFMCFADKLADDEVYSCFTTIITKSKNLAKPELRTLLDELEARVEGCHKKGLNEDELVERAGSSPIKTKGKTPKKAAPKTAQKKKTRRRNKDSSDEENTVENLTPVPCAQRSRQTRKKPALVFSDSDESDIELFQVDKTAKKKGLPEKGRKSDGSDSEPLSPKPRARKGNKRRLTSLHSPLSLSNTPA